ncbi:metalloregulator ArsR/SmtB family transcription factor [Luedemannella helvata]|uniref:Metalloregulator ArsR/SmtB family transcription factor n=1 Tax=Luedemannella helvata TaxID=349315 RepID=A0ABP4VWF7_9ACTN
MSKRLPVLDPATCCAPIATAAVPAAAAGDLAAAFKAMGDPVRLQLLSMIASADGGEVCVCDLTPAFDLTGPTISHHLRVLREAGLVDSDRRGTWVWYRANRAKLAALSAVLDVAVPG